MKKIIYFSVLLVFLSNISRGQRYISDISGRPLTETTNTELGSSIYLDEEFLMGSITMNDNTIYTNLYLRFNLLSNQLTYRKPNSTITYIPEGKIHRFTIELPPATLVSFVNIYNVGEQTDDFYQILFEDSISLVKKVQKKIFETVEYNSTSKTKSLVTSVRYFILRNKNELSPLKQEKKSFVEILGNGELLGDYINLEKLNLKREKDMVQLITYYNSLQK